MQQGQGRGTSNAGGRGSETGGDHKAQDVTHIVQCECAAKPPLNQPSRQNGFTRIAEALEY